MTDHETGHPTAERLRAFLRGELGDEPSAAIEGHLGRCEGCCHLLPTLAEGPDPFLGRLRAARSPAAGGGDVETARADGDGPRADGDGPRADGDGPIGAPTGFEVFGEVGRGGMGVVYKARQVRLNRPVALKMMLAGRHASPAERVRFRAEAEAIARLQHPNIVQIHEIGEHDGLTYLALEFVAGGTLAARIGGTPQAPAASARIAATLARAIHAAHRRGIVHRDLKPGNILLAVEDDEPEAGGLGVPKVTDFGLAKWLGEDRGLTSVGGVGGTPSYMAPEQAAGRPVGPAADVYALGAILYEMLTGRPPFRGVSTPETLSMVQTADPVAPRRLQPGIPRDLETICLKCLEKPAEKRYRTAEDLADDLDRFLDGSPIRARPVGRLERAGRWVRRRPAEAGLLAGLMAVAILGLASVLWQWRAAVVQRGRAERSEADARLAQGRMAAALVDAEDSTYFNQIARAQLRWRLDNDVEGARALLEACRPQPGRPDRRGWEWSYLKGLTGEAGTTLPGPHADYIEAVAFSPDGGLVAAAGHNPFTADAGPNFEVGLWDAASGRRLQRLAGDRRLVSGLAFRPDGRAIAAGARDRVTIWHLDAWRAAGTPIVATLPARTIATGLGDTLDMAFSPDGRRLAVAGRRNALRIWDLADGAVVHELAHGGPVVGARFLPDGRRLATCAQAREALVATTWDLADRPTRRDVVLPISDAPHVRFSRDGRWLATAGARVRVWELDTGRLVNTVAWPSSEARDVSFSPDGRSIATACSDRAVRVWDTVTGEERRTLRGHAGRVTGVDHHPVDGRLVSGGQQPGDVKVWDPSRGAESTRIPIAGDHATEAIAFEASGGRLLAVFPPGDVRAIDPTGGYHGVPRVALTPKWLSPGTIATFSGDGRILATVTGPDARDIQTWAVPEAAEAGGFAPLRTLRVDAHTVYQLALSRDGGRLAAAGLRREGPGRMRRIAAWDLSGGRPARNLPDQRAPVPGLYGSLALSPDGTLLAFDDHPHQPKGAGDDPGPGRSIRLFDLDAGRDRLVLDGHEAMLTAAAFSRDGRLLATADAHGEIRLWDVSRGGRLHDRPMEGPNRQLAFSPDGTRLAAVDRQEVRVWDVRTGREAIRLRGAAFRSGDPGINPQLAWSPDGRRLAASNHDRSLSIWDGGPADSHARERAAAGDPASVAVGLIPPTPRRSPGT